MIAGRKDRTIPLRLGLLPLAVLLAAAGRAEPPPGHLPPPAGPRDPAPLRVALPPGGACEVTLAHWYVQRFAPGPDGAAVIPFRLHRESGTVSLLGPRGDEMAVEGLTCGPEASLHATGARLAFRALAERAAGGGAGLACALSPAGTVCGP